MDHPSRQYELVQAVTPGGVKLHGLCQPPTGSTPSSTTAAIVLHGLGGNFYSSALNLRLADVLQQVGLTVVLGNTRGHDGISSSPVAGRAQTIGTAFEIVDDCRDDIAGWSRFLCDQRGIRSVLLVGHSLGAIKSLYAAAHQPPAAVCGVVALSATRLCHQRLLASPGGALFRKWFDQSCKLVDSGAGEQLMPVEFPFPTWISGQAYRDKYGPEDRYDWVPLAGQIEVPVLLLFGQRELRENPAFAGLQETADQVVASRRGWQMVVIPAADHYYSGVNRQAAQAVGDWVRQQPFGRHGTSPGTS